MKKEPTPAPELCAVPLGLYDLHRLLAARNENLADLPANLAALIVDAERVVYAAWLALARIEDRLPDYWMNRPEAFAEFREIASRIEAVL